MIRQRVPAAYLSLGLKPYINRAALTPSSIMPPKKRRKVSPDEFVVRLRESQKILEHKRLLEVYNVNYIRDNGENLSYVYYIVESIVGCTVDLLRREDGEDADDDDSLWKTCKRDASIRSGVYLVNCPDEGTCQCSYHSNPKDLEIYPEPVHLANGGQGSRPGSRRGASDSPNRNRNVRDTETGVESEVSGLLHMH